MTSKTRNSDRKNGKGWSKSHNAPAKTVSPEKQARRAARKANVSGTTKGSSVTMPRFTWDWAAETMVGGRITGTRKYRMVDACLVRGHGRGGTDAPLVIEANPEAKPVSRKVR